MLSSHQRWFDLCPNFSVKIETIINTPTITSIKLHNSRLKWITINGLKRTARKPKIQTHFSFFLFISHPCYICSSRKNNKPQECKKSIWPTVKQSKKQEDGSNNSGYILLFVWIHFLTNTLNILTKRLFLYLSIFFVYIAQFNKFVHSRIKNVQ